MSVIRVLLVDDQEIILTTYDTDDLVFEGIKAGARGYLLKDAGAETLVEAIRGVMRGESQLDPSVARKVLKEFQRLAAQTPPCSSALGERARGERDELFIEPLTPREEEVLHLLVVGLSNKEIGARLHLTEGTVKNYVSTIISKLQANDQTHPAVSAVHHGLVDLSGHLEVGHYSAQSWRPSSACWELGSISSARSSHSMALSQSPR